MIVLTRRHYVDVLTASAQTVRLPHTDGTTYEYAPTAAFRYASGGSPPRSRIAYAATHVVADPREGIDWERTLAFRRHIWGYGLGVAEAMDTAQRGMGLGWVASKDLIRRSVAEARAVNGRIVCGANTDQLQPGGARDLREVEAALDQIIAAAQPNDLLDIGTGTGRMLEILGPHVGHALGIDQSREMLAVARVNLEHAGLANGSVRLGDMYQLPLADACFDAIVIHQVLHYAERPADAIAEAARV